MTRPIVAAMLSDGADAVLVARTAASVAREWDGIVLLLVPLPRPGFTLNAALAEFALRTREQDAEAIAGRVLPTLHSAGVPVCTRIVWHRRGGSARSILLATLRAARTAGASTLVIVDQRPARSSWPGGAAIRTVG